MSFPKAHKNVPELYPRCDAHHRRMEKYGDVTVDLRRKVNFISIADENGELIAGKITGV